MENSKTRTVAGWTLAVLIAIVFTLASLGKLTGAATPQFEAWGYAPWFALLIGVLELMGALGLLIPRLTRAAILGLTGLMIGAAYTHIANGEGAEVLRPLIFMVLLGVLWWLRKVRT